MAGPLATAIQGQLAELERWFVGRLVTDPAPTDEVVPGERYLDLEFLRSAIERAADMKVKSGYVPAEGEVDDDAPIDLRIAVSRFTRQYASSITAVALTALARGVGLDLSIGRCKMILRGNIPFLLVLDINESQALRCAERPTDWPAAGPTVEALAELRAYVWQKLYAENLALVYERARDVSKVSRRLMWTNAAEFVGLLSDTADEYLTPESAAPFVEDRIALLDAPELPGIGGPNPMRGLLTWSNVTADFPHGHHVREVCCVTYYLPDRLGRLCANCPHLPADERMALIRERHGVPMGTGVSGPAEQTAIRRGLEKLGLAPVK